MCRSPAQTKPNKGRQIDMTELAVGTEVLRICIYKNNARPLINVDCYNL